MRKSLNSIVCALVVIMIGTLTTFAADAAPAPAANQAGVININTADASQFALLPRIGEKAGARIVEYRKANGGFKKTTDLMQVKGIGDKTFQLLSPYLVVDGKTTLTAKVSSPRKGSRAKKQPAPAAQ